MEDKLTSITLAQAREVAKQNALADLADFVGPLQEVLSAEYLEAENYWMFFRSEELDVPLDATLGIKWAFVVSKKGTFSMVQDLSDDLERLQAYLRTLSDHFRQSGE